MSRSRRLQLLALGAALAGIAFVAAPVATTSASPPAAESTAEKKKPQFPKYPETEFERSVIRIPIQFAKDKKPREIVELTAFMRLEREAPVRNTIGYRQFEFTIKDWELFGYSESLGAHISFAASKDVVQPKSLAVALQKNSDYPALIVYNAIYDVFLDGKKIVSQMPGVAMARGVMEIPPRNITVAFQKPFAINRLTGKVVAEKAMSNPDCNGDPECECHYDPNCTIFLPGTCEDMGTIASEEFEAGLKEAKAIRARLATLKPKPTQEQGPAPGGQR